MKKAYPASQTHTTVLRYAPDRDKSLPQMGLDTWKNLSGTIVYFYLANGDGYWFRLLCVEGKTLVGYALVNDWWYFTTLPEKWVLRFY